MVGDKDIEGHLVLTGGGASANIPDIPRPVLRALYNSVVKSKANLFFTYEKCRSVTAHDISQLLTRFQQWARQYDVQATGVSITVKRLRQKGSGFGSTATYQNIEDFLSQEPVHAAATDSIGITFSLLHTNLDTGILENIEAEVNIENLVSVDGFSGVMGQIVVRAMGRETDPFRSFPGHPYPFTLRIKYTDYIVAKAFQALFEDWLDSLDEFSVISENRLLKQLCEYNSDSIFSLGYTSVRMFPLVLCIAVGYGLLSFLGDTLQEAYMFVAGLAVIYVIGDILFRLIVSRFDHPLRPGPPFVSINQGDVKKRGDYKSKILARRKSLKREAWTILSAFAASLLSGWILHITFGT